MNDILLRRADGLDEKVYDLGDGSLNTAYPNENGTWSAEALLEAIEVHCAMDGRCELIEVDDSYLEKYVPRTSYYYKDERGNIKRREDA